MSERTEGGREPTSDYPAAVVESSTAAEVNGRPRARVGGALRSRRNWAQLGKFCAVGATGYVVNLAVYVALVDGFHLHYIPAAMCSFLVAVASNFTWNRLWTFREHRGGMAYQGSRFFIVSSLALVANLAVLHLLVSATSRPVLSQAIAIVLVTPVNFVGNKLWSFGPRR
jgi:putative flippase GtrA